MSRTMALIWIAALFAPFCGFIIWRELRRGNRGQAMGAALGIPGVFICGCAALERVGWLYAPGLVLLGASYVAQFLYAHRARDKAAGRINEHG